MVKPFLQDTMKQISIFLFALAFYISPFCISAQVIDMEPDQIQASQIKSVIITSTPYQSGKVIEDQSRSEAYSFDRTGQLVGRISYATDRAPQTSAIIRYDEHGNRVFHEITVHPLHKTPNVSYQYAYENGRIVREENNNTDLRKLFFYDEIGRVVREELRDGAHNLVETIRYEYDAEGNRIAELHSQEFIERRIDYQYDLEGRITEKKKTTDYSFEKERSTYNCERYVYDIEGRIMHTIRLGKSGKIVGFLNFTYDEAGNLSTKSNGKVTYRYSYNELGMLNQKRKMTAGRMLEEISYEYRLYDSLQESKVASQK